MSKIITFRVTEEISEKLDNLSKELKREKSFIIKSALEQYLNEYSDYLIALDRLKNKDDKIITSEDLRKELGI